METIFLVSLGIILYTYLGYGILLYLCVTVLRYVRKRRAVATASYTPSITLIVPAYNEVDCIEKKIHNSLALQYPADKIEYVFITDGSDDGTELVVAGYPGVKLMHTATRSGKVAAINRAMMEVKTELAVFTDANTLINPGALLHICRHYQDPGTGAVAGEKRIDISAAAGATAGEGIYWKYESQLKKWESELYCVLGAAGELLSIRAALYQPLAPDTISDDFLISVQIASKGYRVRYEPRAYATEKPSLTIDDELKRKIRIAAGGVQSFFRLPQLLLPYPYPILAFEYISHRVIRWIVTPYLLLFVFFANIFLVASSAGAAYGWMLPAQIAWYGMAVAGWWLEKFWEPKKFFWAPYYFCMMNYAMIGGMFRYLVSGQSVGWEKLKRK